MPVTPSLLELGLLPLAPEGDPPRFVVRAGPQVARIRFRHAPEGEEELVEMARGPEGFALTLKPPRAGHRYRYLVDLVDGQRLTLNAAGLQAHEPLDRFDFTLARLGPAWVREKIFYQVFPDRFAVGDPSLGVKDGEYHWRGHASRRLPFDAPPLRYDQAHCLDFRGGDLVGVQQKLDHLAELGADALYLTPIHPAFTNHRYDVTDYEAIDPHLGGEKALSELAAAMHARGMHLVLDQVINHCGSGHRWFNREGRYTEPGAYQDPRSPYAEFFTFYGREPVRYHAWKGIDALPRLDFRSRRLRDLLWGPHGVLRKWLRAPFGIDGYRFDCANMVAQWGERPLYNDVWRELAAALEAERDVYLVGEHWFDPEGTVGPGLLHGAMDYLGFSFPIRRFFTGRDRDGAAAPISGHGLLRQLLDAHAAAQGAAQLVSVNTHDVARLQSAASPAAFRAATALQLFWPGTPSIYYGDEIGLAGGEDPDNRRSMVWDRARWEPEAWAAVHGGIRRRRATRALRDGLLVGLASGDDWAAFARTTAGEVVLAVVARTRCEVALDLSTLGFGARTFRFGGPETRVEVLR